ncbi:YppF family protein, partial [Bacillus vallismortis]|nr:YppF family protein [Bacillus vallismortis]
MNVSYISKRFAEMKKYETDCMNKLMYFAKFLYIQVQLSTIEFRNS